MQKDDVIYRQAAIDAVSYACFELRGVFEQCEDALKALPPAQPEPTFEQIEEYCYKRGLSIVDNALLHKYAQAEIQPEIIHCKDCEHYHKDNNGTYYCRRNGYGWKLNDFCSDAKRRTD